MVVVANFLEQLYAFSRPFEKTKKRMRCLGGSPGLVVMGGDSCSKAHGFKSRFCILHVHDIIHIDFL